MEESHEEKKQEKEEVKHDTSEEKIQNRVEHNVSETKEGLTDRMRQNPWMLSSLVLGVITLVLLFNSFSGGGLTGDVISANDAGERLVAYYESNGANGVELDSVSEDNGLYQVNLKYQGSIIPIHVTKDGSLAGSMSSLSDAGSGSSGTTPAPSAGADVEVGDAPVKGDPDAPVTIIEFSDFSCPFCGGATGGNAEVVEYLKRGSPSWEAPVPKIMEEYVESGQVKFVFKYFPGHGTGQDAMKLSWCADAQGKFWEVHDIYFENQDLVEDYDELIRLAGEAGADMAKLEACYNANSDAFDDRLAEETAEGRAAGVRGTPGFIVNGQLVSGAQSFDAFEDIIEAELAKL